MKELVLKRQNELEEIYGGVHMFLDTDAAREILVGLIDSGLDPFLSFSFVKLHQPLLIQKLTLHLYFLILNFNLINKRENCIPFKNITAIPTLY